MAKLRQVHITVADLASQLVELDQEGYGDAVVVLSRDSEGNGFRPLYKLETGTYEDGEAGIAELTPALAKQGFTDADVLGQKALILWPG